jgi:hypothetical protein
MTKPMLALAGLGLVLLALTGAGMAIAEPHPDAADYVFRGNLLVGLMMVAVGFYFAAVALVLKWRLPGKALWLILGVAIALRAILLPAQPFLSTDAYRYVWDGWVQAAGINPYRYIPADPALASLRDDAIYPLINRPDYARTIYPPMAQLVFAAVGRVWGSMTGLKLTMMGFEALAVGCLLRLLPMAGLPRERVLIYAWNPLAFWSFASDGHVDAIAVGLLGLALLLRARRRDGWAGAVLGAATLVKFFPAVVAPAFLRGGTLWRPAFAGAAVIVALYAIYSSAGAYVLGFLPAYGTEEGLADGSGFWLLSGLSRMMVLPAGATAAYLACAAVGLVALAVFIARGRAPGNDVALLCRDAGLLIAATMVAVSPHYPWYFAWLALPCVIAPSWTLLWLSAAPLMLYLNPWPHDRFIWPSLLYLPALVLLGVDLWRHRISEGTLPCPARPL